MDVVVAFGTKPCTIKMAPLVKELEKRGHEVTILYTGQHWSPNMYSELFDDLELRHPDYDLKCGEDSRSLPQLTSLIISRSEKVLKKVKPDIVLTHGDTTTSLAVSQTAYMSLFPVGHIEAGLRTFSREPFPEQLNTRVTDASSDYFFAPTEMNARFLLNEGFPKDRIVVVGNTVVDVAKWAAKRKPDILKKYGLEKPLVYLSVHRRETTMDRKRFSGPFDAAREFDDVNFFVSMRPGTKKALVNFGMLNQLKKTSHIATSDSLSSYVETISMINQCEAILTDSGSMQEEAAALHIPCLTLRYVTDRPETVDSGANLLVGLKKGEVLDGLRRVLRDGALAKKMRSAKSPYGDGDSSMRIVRFLEKAHEGGNLIRFEKAVRSSNKSRSTTRI
ncbi:MAG: UDP-N-acetylglucosamine 2-epimerase (non-hydrolyzing) [Methanobacteriota archaeon]